jgi:hypothetical protein
VPSAADVRAGHTVSCPATIRAAVLLIETDSISLIGPIQSVIEQYVDTAHFSDGVASLKWQENDLVKLIELRVEKRIGKKWKDVFGFHQGELVSSIFPYLVNGPRDLMLLLNTAGKRADVITKDMLLAALPTLRSQRWSDCDRQFGRRWPKISNVAKSILAAIPNSSRMKTTSVPKEEIKNLIKSEIQKPGTALHKLRAVDWVNSALWMEPSIDERLFLCGFLGYELNGEKQFPWMGCTLSEYRQADKIIVSQLFIDS